MAIKFVNQVTKRLNALWNTSLQLSPRELEEGPVMLTNDIGQDLVRSFQGSIYIVNSLAVGSGTFRRADVIAALHSSVPTLGNAPARLILDRDDIEYIQFRDFWYAIRVSATAGEIYPIEVGVQVTGTTYASVFNPVIDSTNLTIPAGGVITRNSATTSPELKKTVVRLASDQISASLAGGLPMPEYVAPNIGIFPPGVMAAPATVTMIFTYAIDLVYKRPYQAIQNNQRSATTF